MYTKEPPLRSNEAGVGGLGSGWLGRYLEGIGCTAKGSCGMVSFDSAGDGGFIALTVDTAFSHVPAIATMESKADLCLSERHGDKQIH